MTYINRAIEGILKNRFETSKSVAITGARQVGKTTNPKSEMASAFDVLDKDIDKKRGIGAIICRGDYKLKLRDNLYALPIEYI